MAIGNMQTVQQVADFLQVPEDAIESEIQKGRLEAVQIGPYFRISDAALEDFLNRASTTMAQSTKPSTEQKNDIRLQQAPNFFHIWPDKQKEKFVDAQEGVAEYLGTSYQVKIGFTVRYSAGKDRRRSLVLINHYPTVEFVSADTRAGGNMASIIRDRAGKRLPVGATVPQEYAAMPVGPYKDVVVGTGAPSGMAVICNDDKIETMVRHALIRFRYRQEKTA
jgi:excisionase family DNA binding protein